MLSTMQRIVFYISRPCQFFILVQFQRYRNKHFFQFLKCWHFRCNWQFAIRNLICSQIFTFQCVYTKHLLFVIAIAEKAATDWMNTAIVLLQPNVNAKNQSAVHLLSKSAVSIFNPLFI